MSNQPTVSTNFTNNNLLKQVAVIDGEAAFIGNAHTIGNAGKIYVVNSLADAETQGLTSVLEPEAHRQLSEFYTELKGKQEVFIMLLGAAVTMAQMMDSTSLTNGNLLIQQGAGKIAYLGVFKSYAVAGADFMDTDLAPTLTAAKTFVEFWNGKGYYFRVLVGGYVSDETSNTIFAPNTASNDYAGVVLFSTANDKTASVGLALGRKVKYPSHIKLGKVANGPLSVPTLYIGTKTIDKVANLDSLAGLGYIVPTLYPNKSGVYIGVDYMANNDDYSILAYGAVIDAAARVAQSYYTDWLESETDVDGSGKLLDEDAAHLEDNIKAQINFSLGDRISGVDATIDRGQTIVPGNTLTVGIAIRPKGYFTFINVNLGLTA